MLGIKCGRVSKFEDWEEHKIFTGTVLAGGDPEGDLIITADGNNSTFFRLTSDEPKNNSFTNENSSGREGTLP